ncbi:MAG: D-glycero-beta-D-manno-heptose 1,7-bisphosphate 7-phosphatase [Chloroflexi bacterium]|nr:D-glycero-beta-D-manno-heptose 1,7-bisphosphate 7-phosphatase [Chloroflexota bacterium]
MRTVFVDRDGVINRYRDDYVKSWEEFEFLPGSLDALRRLAASRFRVIVITNQSVVNRGLVSREVVEDINIRMVSAVAASGGNIEAVLYCPHRPDESCECRKPRPGLFYRARDELSVDLAKTFLVGDNIADIEAARAAGCGAAILVLGGHPSAESALPAAKDGASDVRIAVDLGAAVEMILAAS